MDTLQIEGRIREAYRQLDVAARDRYRNPANWYGRLGAGVDLADLRAALPPDLTREEVDKALRMLADHSDVHLWPKSDQKHASDRDRAAALQLGGSHHHAIAIDRQQDPDLVVERLRSRPQDNAESMVAALDDETAAQVAQRMGVEPSDDPAVLRQRLIDTSAANHAAWVADARQGEEDGSLLYRADTEPEWVATWTVEDRQWAAEAGQRLLDRADRDQTWAYIRERAARWAASGPTPESSGDQTGSLDTDRQAADEHDDATSGQPAGAAEAEQGDAPADDDAELAAREAGRTDGYAGGPYNEDLFADEQHGAAYRAGLQEGRTAAADEELNATYGPEPTDADESETGTATAQTWAMNADAIPQHAYGYGADGLCSAHGERCAARDQRAEAAAEHAAGPRQETAEARATSCAADDDADGL